jgi:DNA ligase-1
MLATPQETPADAAQTIAGRAFVAEDKLDGIRAQVHKTGDGPAARVAIYTRTMDRADHSFPDVVAAAARLTGEFLLDGEIVPYRDGVVLPFANIQKRLGRKTLSPRLLADYPAAFVAFDILYRNGQLLMDRPLRQRRAALADLAGVDDQATPTAEVDAVPAQPKGPLLVTTPTLVTSVEQIESAFARSRQSRNEGLVLKDQESLYSPGRRGQMWLKLKTHLPTLDCVVTAAEFGHGKRRNSLSDYTFAVWDRDPADPAATLVNVGKAYSGVTDEEIARLTELFLQLSQSNNGRVHQVEPKLVLEIAADQIQKSDRHASGYALRFPRIKRVRWDKRPIDADRLERVAELYQSLHNFGRNDPPAPPAPQPTLFDGL